MIKTKKEKRKKKKKLNVLICIEFGSYFKKYQKNIFFSSGIKIIILYIRYIHDIK
jgi:hypothetical protein